jgi:hypothetical protein
VGGDGAARVGRRPAHSDLVVATFDDRLGYPSTVSIDRIRNAIDDELTVVVRDFEPTNR